MNYTTLFYWLTVADNARTMFNTGIWIFTAISVISTICYFMCMHTTSQNCQTEEDKLDQASSRKWMWWGYPLMFLFWSLYVLTPSKRDALLIVAGGQTMNFLTTDKSAKQLPSELSHFLVTEIKNMATANEVKLNIADQKNKILEEAKTMSSAQLLDRIKTDSTFAKIVTEK